MNVRTMFFCFVLPVAAVGVGCADGLIAKAPDQRQFDLTARYDKDDKSIVLAIYNIGPKPVLIHPEVRGGWTLGVGLPPDEHGITPGGSGGFPVSKKFCYPPEYVLLPSHPDWRKSSLCGCELLVTRLPIDIGADDLKGLGLRIQFKIRKLDIASLKDEVVVVSWSPEGGVLGEDVKPH